MKLTAPAIVLSGLCAAKVWASALPAPIDGLKAPIDGYGVTIPEWEVEVSPGGPKIKLSGTVEEVHSELLRRNPDWDTHYPTNNTEESPSLNKRRTFEVAGHFCDGRWKPCSVFRIKEGIAYLRRLGGPPTIGPGPSKCSRVSCSYQSAIWWCNDAPHRRMLLGGYNELADGAAFLLDKCPKSGSAKKPRVAGQVFTPYDWNIIVREDKTKRC